MTPSHRRSHLSSLTSSKPLSGSAVKTFFSRAGIGFGMIQPGGSGPLLPRGCLLNVTLESIRDSRNFTFLTRKSRTSCFFPEKSSTKILPPGYESYGKCLKKKAAFVFQTTDQQEFFQINELLHTTSHSPRYSSGRASANPSPSPSATLRQISLSVNPLCSRSEIRLKPTTQN